jgi:protein-arginine kinase activator protein McsA
MVVFEVCTFPGLKKQLSRLNAKFEKLVETRSYENGAIMRADKDFK